jgi:hypothetical protein
LPYFRWRDKAAVDEVVLENIGNSLCVTFIGFLPFDSLNVLRTSQNQIAGFLKNIPYRNPIGHKEGTARVIDGTGCFYFSNMICRCHIYLV